MPILPICNTNVVDLIDECYVFNAISRKTVKIGKIVVSEAPDDPTCQYELDQLLKIKRGGNHIYKIIRAQAANLDRNLDRVLTPREYRNHIYKIIRVQTANIDRNADRILTQRYYRHLEYKIRAICLAVRRYIDAATRKTLTCVSSEPVMRRGPHEVWEES